jgi:hypothetical protein
VAAPANPVPPNPAVPSTTDIENGVVIGLYNVAGDAIASDSASNGGGPVILGCQLELIFWGDTWRTGPNLSGVSPASVVNAVENILTGPYLMLLGQYGFNSVAIQGTTLVTVPPPPPSYTLADVENMVWNLIDDGKFPEPDEPGGRTLYMVFMPNGSNPPAGLAGSHGDMSDFDLPADVDWLWAGMVSYGTLDLITKVFSHEFVEAITDPEPDSPAWQMSRSLNGGNEIGDACNNTTDRIDAGLLVQAYWSQEHHRCAVPLHLAPSPRRAGSMLLQGTFGTSPVQPIGNFEVVAQAGPGLGHWWRNNTGPGLPWTFTTFFGDSLGPTSASAVIQSNFGPGNLEVVALGAPWGPTKGQLWHFWRDTAGWHQGVEIAAGVTGVGVGFIQSGLTVLGQTSANVRGDFHVVAPLIVGDGLNGGLGHWTRLNDRPGLPWTGQGFGGDLGLIDEVSLIQSNPTPELGGWLSHPGPLELVARRSGELWHFWLDADGWHHDSGPFATGVAGGVSFIQSSFGQKGNFEVVASLLGGGLGHWWRNNDDSSLPWAQSTTFAADLQEIGPVSLIESNMSSPGLLEVVIQSVVSLWHLWRDNHGWHHDGGPFADIS